MKFQRAWFGTCRFTMHTTKYPSFLDVLVHIEQILRTSTCHVVLTYTIYISNILQFCNQILDVTCKLAHYMCLWASCALDVLACIQTDASSQQCLRNGCCTYEHVDYLQGVYASCAQYATTQCGQMDPSWAHQWFFYAETSVGSPQTLCIFIMRR